MFLLVYAMAVEFKPPEPMLFGDATPIDPRHCPDLGDQDRRLLADLSGVELSWSSAGAHGAASGFV